MMMPWTPFTCLPAAALTPSGLIQFDTQDQEVELVRRGPLELRWEGNTGSSGGNGGGRDGTSIEAMAPCPKEANNNNNGNNSRWNGRHSKLLLIVTTHRLVFQQLQQQQAEEAQQAQAQQQARFVHLSNVHSIEATGGPTLMHPNASYKLIVSTYTYGDLIVAFLSSNNSNKKDRDALEVQLSKALSRKQWEMATRLQERQDQAHVMARRRVGVDHILTKHKLKHQQAQKVANEALSGDAEQLLQQASALLQVIQNYTKLLQQQQQQKQQQQNQQDNTTNENEQQDAEKLSLLLQDMGMTSALTKDHFAAASSLSASTSSAKGRGRHRRRRGRKREDQDAAYYEWLARQVVDFLWTRLPAMGGVISLTDVYCLWNRARGSNLVSPEDLRHACDLLRDDDDDEDDDDSDDHDNGRAPPAARRLCHLGITQRTFDSGVVVLQMNSSSFTSNKKDGGKFQELVEMCPTTALEASHKLHVSPLLAFEQLKQAEQEGWLCRDTTLETTRFYPNRFATF